MGTGVSALSPAKNSGKLSVQGEHGGGEVVPKYIHQKPLFLEKEEDSYFTSLAPLFLSRARESGL